MKKKAQACNIRLSNQPTWTLLLGDKVWSPLHLINVIKGGEQVGDGDR